MSVTVIGGVRPPSVVVADFEAGVARAVAEWGRQTTDRVRAEWSGWQNPTGRSQAGWTLVGPIAAPDGLRVEIVNDVPYVPFVHRRGQGVPTLDQILRDIFPDAEAALRGELSAVAASTPLTA